MVPLISEQICMFFCFPVWLLTQWYFRFYPPGASWPVGLDPLLWDTRSAIQSQTLPDGAVEKIAWREAACEPGCRGLRLHPAGVVLGLNEFSLRCVSLPRNALKRLRFLYRLIFLPFNCIKCAFFFNFKKLSLLQFFLAPIKSWNLRREKLKLIKCCLVSAGSNPTMPFLFLPSITTHFSTYWKSAARLRVLIFLNFSLTSKSMKQ